MECYLYACQIVITSVPKQECNAISMHLNQSCQIVHHGNQSYLSLHMSYCMFIPFISLFVLFNDRIFNRSKSLTNITICPKHAWADNIDLRIEYLNHPFTWLCAYCTYLMTVCTNIILL